MEMPLSTYVVIKFCMALAMIGSCLGALNEPKFTDGKCEFSGSGKDIGLENWLYVQLGFAGLHLVFSPYFQCRLWGKVNMMASQLPRPPPGEPLTVPGDKVHEAFKDIFLTDIGVCLYFLATVANFVWSYLGSTWITDGGPSCGLNSYPGWSYYLGMCFCWVAVVYTTLWYCCSCCSSSVVLREQPVIQGYAGPGQIEMMS